MKIGISVGEGITRVSIKAVQDLMKVIKWCSDLKYKKSYGSTNIQNLLARDSQVSIAQVPTNLLDDGTFKKIAKKAGILYTVLPDFDYSDGMTQVMYHTSAAPRMELVFEQLKSIALKRMEDTLSDKIRNIEPEEYIQTAKGEDVIQLLCVMYPEIEEPIKKNEQIEIEIKRQSSEEQRELIGEIEENERSNPDKYVSIQFDKSQVVAENKTHIKIVSPNDLDTCMWIPKKNLKEKNGTYWCAIQKEQEITITDLKDTYKRNVKASDISSVRSSKMTEKLEQRQLPVKKTTKKR